MGILEFIVCIAMILVTGIVALAWIIAKVVDDDTIIENENLRNIISEYEYKESKNFKEDK